MNPPKLLLLSCTHPGPEGVGGIILRDLCAFYPPDSMCLFLPWPEDRALPRADDLRYLPFETAPRRFEKLAPIRFGRLGKALGYLTNEIRFRKHVEQLTHQAIALASKHAVSMVWTVLDAPTSMAMALPVAKGLGVPLISTVWDDANHIARSMQLDRATAAATRKRCYESIRGSLRCAVISDAMKQDYEARLGTECVILRHGLPSTRAKPVKQKPNEGDILRIGFAGTMYASDAFRALLKALDSVSWKLAGKRVVLRVMGGRLDLWSTAPIHVEFMGWRELDDTIQLLSETDITYLPQPFSDEAADLAALSFPTKLTTYLAAGCPIFLHAPLHASLARYYQARPFASWCDSLDPAQVIDRLRALVSGTAEFARVAAAGREVLSGDFSQATFRESFARFVGVEASSLRGAAVSDS